MDYETCLKSCIETTRAHGGANAETDIAIFSGYPVPTAGESADVVEETATYSDAEDPFNCMAQYEMRLDRCGIKTVFCAAVDGLVAGGVSMGISPEEQARWLEALTGACSDLPVKH